MRRFYCKPLPATTQRIPTRANTPTDNYLSGLQAGVRGWRIALVSDAYFYPVGRLQIRQAVRQAAQVFEQLGAQVIPPVDCARRAQRAPANGLMVTSDGAALS